MCGRSECTPEREGFALPVAVFALVIVGVLVTGGFYMANQESRIGAASEHGTRALYLAETGLADVMSNWNAEDRRLYTLPPDVGATSDGNWQVSVARLNEQLYYLESTSALERGDRYAGASRTVGMTIRVDKLDDIAPPAALVTRGNVRLVGTAEIQGHDLEPDGWGGYCQSGLDDKPGLMHDGSGTVELSGGASMDGEPADSTDTTISDETFNQFGPYSWEELTALADIVVPGGTINGTGPTLNGAGECDKTNDYNWGRPAQVGDSDPPPPCTDYFPIIHVTDHAMIQSGGVGQGILLVDGNLDLRGDFVFYGIIIVQGSFETQGGGNRVMGGVMAANADIDNQQYSGSSVIQSSSCAVERAILNAPITRPRPLGRRSWVDVSAIRP
jgi:hypothetical protein